MEEPPKTKTPCVRQSSANSDTCDRAKQRRSGALRQELMELASYFKMPTFSVLIIQGIFGMTAGSCFSYLTLYFQLRGVTDMQASLIGISGQIAGALGSLIGGVVGDRLSRCSKHHGRPLTAQISVLCGFPTAWLILMTEPPENGTFAYYVMLTIAGGLIGSWCAVAVNLPILSQIVKEDRRATIMAWQSTLESASASILSNAMVGFFAQNMFGYNLAGMGSADASLDMANARALGKAIISVAVVPWMLCFCFYSLLHWSYPRDMRRLAQQDQEQQAQSSDKVASKDCCGLAEEDGDKVEAEQSQEVGIADLQIVVAPCCASIGAELEKERDGASPLHAALSS